MFLEELGGSQAWYGEALRINSRPASASRSMYVRMRGPLHGLNACNAILKPLQGLEEPLELEIAGLTTIVELFI